MGTVSAAVQSFYNLLWHKILLRHREAAFLLSLQAIWLGHSTTNPEKVRHVDAGSVHGGGVGQGDFDLSRDGDVILFDRIQESSRIALIDRGG